MNLSSNMNAYKVHSLCSSGTIHSNCCIMNSKSLKSLEPMRRGYPSKPLHRIGKRWRMFLLVSETLSHIWHQEAICSQIRSQTRSQSALKHTEETKVVVVVFVLVDLEGVFLITSDVLFSSSENYYSESVCPKFVDPCSGEDDISRLLQELSAN